MAIKTLKIEPGAFKGLNQSLDDNLLNWAFSPDCQNVDVVDGNVATRKGIVKHIPTVLNPEDATHGWMTIRRIFELSSSAYGTVLIAGLTSSDDQIHNWYAYGLWSTSWVLITGTDGTTPAMTSVVPEQAHAVEYKIGSTSYVIIVGGGNPQKAYIAVGAGPTYTKTMQAIDLGGSPATNTVFIALHRERIWIGGHSSGTSGTYFDGVNTVHYSNALLAEDWSTSGETGEIEIETFDGDYIRGMANILDDVLIFKKNTVWRIDGDIPSEYTPVQVISVQGTIWGDSICSDGNNCFFAGSDGIYKYTGTEATPILTDEIKDIYASAVSPKGVITNNTFYLFDLKSTGSISGKIIVYDIYKKQLSVMYSTKFIKDMIISLNKTTNKEEMLLTDGYYVYELSPTAILDDATAIDLYWYTPESDCGAPNAIKTLTDIYLTAWGTTSAGASGAQMKITAYYNRSGTQKTKVKTVTLLTTRKNFDMRFNVDGRIFKFKIENISGSAINVSNMMFKFELDED